MKLLAYGLAASLSLCAQTTFAAPVQNLAKANNEFGVQLFHQVLKQDADKNVFISPVSAQMALAMVANGAEGATLAEMQETLALQGHSLAEINAGVEQYLTAIDSLNSDFTLSIANSLWINQTLRLNESYRQSVVDSFRAEANTLDFLSPSASVQINGWVAEKTNHKITNVVPAVLSPDMMMYLINATYFKADWTHPFDSTEWDKKYTAPFTTLSGAVEELPTMRKKAYFKHVATDRYEAIELPYGQAGNASMFVVLPKTKQHFEDFVQELQLADMDQVVNLLGKAKLKQVQLEMPKFTFEYQTDLVNILSEMGMPTAFTGAADFSGMSPDGLKIGQAFQKTFVAVDEKGTEAAAVTVIGMETTSIDVRPVTQLKINRPFVFGIKENKTGSLLFLGSIVKPEIK